MTRVDSSPNPNAPAEIPKAGVGWFLLLGMCCYSTYSSLWGKAPGWVLGPALVGLAVTLTVIVRRSRWFQRRRTTRGSPTGR
jgi:hypothetical protein